MGWGGLCLSPLKGELEGVLWVGEVPLSPIPLQRYCFSAIFVGKVLPIMRFLSILNPFFSFLITDRHPIVHYALRIAHCALRIAHCALCITHCALKKRLNLGYLEDLLHVLYAPNLYADDSCNF